MSNETARRALARLARLPLPSDDTRRSHIALMYEYFRRSALWAQALGNVEQGRWPFFDVAAHISPTERAPAELVQQLEQHLTGWRQLMRDSCFWYLHWTALQDSARVQDFQLPDPYEPLLVMYERGGWFYRHHHELKLGGWVGVMLGGRECWCREEPVVSLDEAVLDTLDLEGWQEARWIGPFAALWQTEEAGVPAHLELLHFRAEAAQQVLDRIETALTEGDSGHWLHHMFQELTWRPHLVAAAATLMLQERQKWIPVALWVCLKQGSWVSPQLAATLSFIDPQFLDQTRKRVEEGAPVALPQRMSDGLRHAAMGPAGSYQRSCKEVSALLALCDTFPEARDWVADIRQTPTIATMIREDSDHADSIALSWAQAATRQFRRRGLDLDPENRLDAYLRSGKWRTDTLS